MDFSNYQIPLNWEIKPLKDACQFSKKPRGLIVKGKIPFFPMEIIPQNGIYAKTSIYKNSDEIGSSTFINNGDVVVAKITPSFENGKQAIIDIEESYAYATTEVIPFNEIAGISNKLFLFYVLKHPVIRSTLAGQMEGSTGRQRLSKEVIGRYKIPLPPPEEQRKIAGVLSLVQDAIAQQEKLITLTTELKKALMQKLFTEGTRGELQNWDIIKLEGAVEYIDYGFSKAIPKVPPENGVKIVSTADINRQGQLLYSKIRYIEAPQKTIQRLTLKNGDILFNWRNSLELIGKTTIFEEQSEPHIFASFILRLRCDEIKTHNYYLKHLLNYWRECGIFSRLARRAVNQANYNKNEISVLNIPLPDYYEQLEIANQLNLIESKLSIINGEKQQLQDLFRTLLHQLMTAQIRVDDLNLSALNLEPQGGNE
jgi:type I restriction enzyme S subunit